MSHFVAEIPPKWLEQKAVEQQIGNLNDEIENLKQEKKKHRALAEQKEVAIKSKDKEIKDLEREVKTLIQVRKDMRKRVNLNTVGIWITETSE